MKINRIYYEDYDFLNKKASEGRNAIHDYPAMFHYMLVSDLLKIYGENCNVVYDPFCGSGVTIVESLKQGKTAIGTDINPLALLISKVRASNIEHEHLEKIISLFRCNLLKLKLDIPKVKNLSYWFKEYISADLGKIRYFIKNYVNDESIKDFLLVAFSQTVRDVSNNKKGEFKRFRIKQNQLLNYNPDVFGIFLKNINLYSKILINDKLNNTDFYLYKSDISKEIPFNKKVDIIITSPPYGDSKTTVAYGQFCSFSFDWLNGLNKYGDSNLMIDNQMLGGNSNNRDVLLNFTTLQDTIIQLNKKDIKRSKEVFNFFYDFYLCCQKFVKTLSDKAVLIFVVGNRNVKEMQIPMDIIVAEFFEYFGFTYEKTLIRKISNKRMPTLNSPTNKTGEKSTTMKNEYIVICKKE